MRRIILLLAATLLVGCDNVHSPDEITGSYVGVLPHATVFLVLRSDHTYSERLDYFDGRHEAVSGTWFWGYRESIAWTSITLFTLTKQCMVAL